MRPNPQLREFIMRWLRENGGHARCKEIHAAIIAAGLTCHERKVTYHLNILIGEGRLTRTSAGIYWIPEVLARNSPDQMLAKMPFGTTIKGRILYAMIVRRLFVTAEIEKDIRGKGKLRARQSLNTALTELKDEGWAESLGYGTTVPTEKAYRHAGFVPRDDRATVQPPLAVRARDPIMAYLRKHGPTRTIVLIKLFGEKPDREQRNGVNGALQTLADNGYVRKVSRGVYEATAKPYPGGA
jgi:hypothetical protein